MRIYIYIYSGDLDDVEVDGGKAGVGTSGSGPVVVAKQVIDLERENWKKWKSILKNQIDHKENE